MAQARDGVPHTKSFPPPQGRVTFCPVLEMMFLSAATAAHVSFGTFSGLGVSNKGAWENPEDGYLYFGLRNHEWAAKKDVGLALSNLASSSPTAEDRDNVVSR